MRIFKSLFRGNPSKPKLRWYQFSLRTLLMLAVLVSIGMSWVAVKIQQAKKRREAAEAITKAGGFVIYDYAYDFASGTTIEDVDPPGPAWLRRLLGEEFFFTDVVFVGVTNDAAMQHLDVLTQIRGMQTGGITDAGMEHLKGLIQLEWLNLECKSITDTGLRHLKGLSRLKFLNLLLVSGVTDVGLEHLTSLTQLQVLCLACTNVTDAGLEHLKGLRELQDLSLEHTQISDTGLEHLKGLTKLKKLSLLRTKVTNRGLMKLKQELPNCRIAR